jgi:hypothetical protein
MTVSLMKTVGLAGRVGFEPTVEYYPDNHLAGGPIRPLWHLPVFLKIEDSRWKIEDRK